MLANRRTYGKRQSYTAHESEDDAQETPPSSQHSLETKLTSKSDLTALNLRMTRDEDTADEEVSHLSGTIFKGKESSPPARLKSASLSVAQIMQNTDSEEEEEEDESSAYDRLRHDLFQPKHAALDCPEQDRLSASLEDSDIELPDVDVAIQAALKQSAHEKVQQLAERRRRIAEENAAKVMPEQKSTPQLTDSGSDSEDVEAGIRLSSARQAPRRAATKKAIEEMHKETERISRSMTLAPKAHVKTKLSVNDFLSKIGYLRPQIPDAPKDPDVLETHMPNHLADPLHSTMTTPKDSGPPLPASVAPRTALEDSDSDIELPDLQFTSLPKENIASPDVRRSQQDVILDSDSNSDVEVSGPLKSHKLLFKKRNYEQIRRDRRAAKFVAMARPDSPTKIEARAEKARKSALLINVSRQARLEREAREQAMKAAGITIISAEERQLESAHIENLVEKARRQATDLRHLEERENHKAKAELNGLNDSASDDNDWNGDEEGSESADTEDDDSSVADNTSDVESSVNCLLSKSQLGRVSSVLSERNISDDEEVLLPVMRRPITSKTRTSRVVPEDSEEDKENTIPKAAAGPAAEDLSQFFQPTQTQLAEALGDDFTATQLLRSQPQKANDMQGLRDLVSNVFNQDGKENNSSADQLHFGPELWQRDTHDGHRAIPSSQGELPFEGSQAIGTQFSLFDPPSPDYQVVPLPATLHPEYTQMTEVDMSQGQIYQDLSTKADQARPRNRLRKANDDDLVQHPPIGKEAPVSAFRRMREAMDQEHFQKARKAFVDDRAVESDDEYAGLGGVSDDEPEDVAAMEAEMSEMIDHNAVDEDEDGQRKIAAFYAKKDLENDEKLVNNLMNDISNGGLRRRRGAGLLDMEDSEDEEEEAARYKARQAQIRARLLEAHNLNSLADNPKTKAFIEALEDRPSSLQYIYVAGEDEIAEDRVPATQLDGSGSTSRAPQPSLQRTDTLIDEEMSQSLVKAQMQPPSKVFRRSNKFKSQAEIRDELSFLREDDDDSQNTSNYDPAFVPSLKRERSSLVIEDRLHLSRENSQTWHDPRTSITSEASMYSALAASRKTESESAKAPVTVVVSKGHQMASKMATKAVSYHAKAAQAMRAGRMKLPVRQTKSVTKGKEFAGTSKKDDVLKLLA